MNVTDITSALLSGQIKNGSNNKNKNVVSEGFSSILISEMLKSADVFKEEQSTNYASMFRWQFANHLSKSLTKELNLNLDSVQNAYRSNSFADFKKKGVEELKALTEKLSLKEDIDPNLVKAVIQVESSWNKDAVSNKGAKGLMQLIDDTAKRFSVKSVFNPIENISGGIKFLKHLLGKFGGDLESVLAAYNAGEGAVKKYGGVPPYKETQEYIKKVLSVMENNDIDNNV